MSAVWLYLQDGKIVAVSDVRKVDIMDVRSEAVHAGCQKHSCDVSCEGAIPDVISIAARAGCQTGAVYDVRRVAI
jgi:3-mercaptopyruvate sulfurtransferase SseA